MSDARVILCPGQGAQRVGMGKAWLDASAEAAQTFGAADQIVGDRLGAPISRLCFEGPEETLNRTDVAQPAIYTASVACFQALLGAGDGDEVEIAAAAGLSLGEYTALHVAGAMSFRDGLELVLLRGQAMQQAAEAQDGGMVALIGADEAQAQSICDEAADGRILVLANFNAPGQIVLSGHADACERAVETAGEKGIRATRLPVAGAFHSPVMAPAADRLADALQTVELRPPVCPVPSNVTGLPHGHDEQGDIIESVRRRLIEQLTRPVRWDECCRWLVGGVEGALHELAPGKTLAGLMRRIERSVKVETHDEPSSG